MNFFSGEKNKVKALEKAQIVLLSEATFFIF